MGLTRWFGQAGVGAVKAGGRVSRGLVRRVASRLADGIRDGVDLGAEPVEGQGLLDLEEEAQRLVVQGPARGGDEKAPAEGSSGESKAVAGEAAAGGGSSLDLALFERVEVTGNEDGTRLGEVYEIHEGTPRAFDILTYSNAGVPELLKGIDLGRVRRPSG